MFHFYTHSKQEKRVSTTQLCLTKQHTWELQGAMGQLQKGTDALRFPELAPATKAAQPAFGEFSLEKLMEALLSLGSPQK